MNKVLFLGVFGFAIQAWGLVLQQSLVAPYANLLQQNMANTHLLQDINSSVVTVFQNMAAYNTYMTNLTNQILEEHHANIQAKANQFKSTFRSTEQRSIIYVNTTNPVVNCLIEEGNFDVLVDEVNNQIKKCATVAMAEMVNVISNSLAEAQTFMSIPQVIGRDIQRCGLSSACRWDIVGDAISEALQVPPKVFALTAKIQSIALRTVVSIDSCGLQGLRQIAETGVTILGGIFECISVRINSTNNAS